jgi:transcription-repair coupling factor (superfamily II helicase)
LKEFTELGSGYRIALRDLEIRGAGNLLGAEQHGYIAAVGFDLYCQLLSEAVAGFKGQKIVRRDESPVLDLPVQAYLPETYVPDARQKLAVYRKMALVRNDEALSDLEEELRDRFGPMPGEVLNLLAFIRLKLEALGRGVAAIRRQGEKVSVLHPLIPDLPREVRKDISLAADGRVEFREYCLLIGPCGKETDWLSLADEVIRRLPAIK